MQESKVNKILVIDDERSVAYGIASGLELDEKNYVEVVFNSIEVSNKLEKKNYNIIISDLFLSNGDYGFDYFFKRISNNCNKKILMSSLTDKTEFMRHVIDLINSKYKGFTSNYRIIEERKLYLIKIYLNDCEKFKFVFTIKDSSLQLDIINNWDDIWQKFELV